MASRSTHRTCPSCCARQGSAILIYPSSVHKGGKTLVLFPEDRYKGIFYGVVFVSASYGKITSCQAPNPPSTRRQVPVI